MLRKSLKITFFNLTLAGVLWAQAQVLDITSPTSGQSIDTSDVTVSFTMAAYFAVGDSACTDCDGFVRAFLNDVQVASVNSTADFTISGVTDGSYMLKLEAVNPTGTSFDPVIEDTVSFNVVGNPELCAPYDVLVYSGDGRNTIEWSEPVLGASGGLGCGDFVVTALPFTDVNTNVGMGDNWDVTFGDTEDVAYTLNLSSETTIDVTLCSPNTDYDTKLEIFTFDGTDCDSTYTDAVTTGNYNDDGTFGTCPESPAPYTPSLLENVTLAAGQYYIIVDGFGTSTGNYEINVTESTGRAMTQYTMDDYNLELLKSGLDPDDLFAEFQNLENARNSSTREIDVICGTFVQYNIYNLADGSLAGSSDTTYFLHENLTNGTEYCYYVRAEYAEGESTNSDTACATPAAFVAEPATNLLAIPLDEEVSLSWTVPGTQSYVYFEDFDDNVLLDLWLADGGNWSWYELTGNPVPCMRFYWSPSSDNYDQSLYSPVIPLGDSTEVTVGFDFEFSNFTATGAEFLSIEYKTGTDTEWTVLEEFANTDPAGFSFTNFSYDVVNLTDNIQVRFHCYGATTFDINWYYIDNFAVTSTNRQASRWNDGDLTHYNVYLDGVLVEDSVEVMEYLVTGLTNATTYTFGVTAAYYPDYESDAISASATPTWLYGDVTGTITDANGTPLDSAIVSTGDFSDTTGSDGTYFLEGLNPGIQTIRASRAGFDWVETDVTVIAQDAAVTSDFVLPPFLMVSNGLEATAGDETIHLIWNKPGTVTGADLVGEWTLFFDWYCSGFPSNVNVEFRENGEFWVLGLLEGGWVAENNTVDLATGLCDAILFEYNAYFYFDGTPTIYYVYVEEDVFTGVTTEGFGAHDGDNSGERLTAAAMREAETFDETNIAGIID